MSEAGSRTGSRRWRLAVARRSPVLGACLALLVAAGQVAAAGPAFTGLAAKADSPDTAFSNPAGMSRLPDGGLTVEAILAKGLGEFRVDQSATTTSGGDPDNDSTPVFVPFVYYVRPVSDAWHVGVSLTVPTGFGSSYGDSWAGRYYSDQYSLIYVSLTTALAYRVDERLSLGAAVSFNFTRSQSEVAINSLAPGAADGRLETTLDGIGTNLTVSALWQATAQTRLGIVYSSAADAELEGDLDFKNPGPVLEPVLEALGLIGADLEIDNTLPQRILFGAYHELGGGRFLTADVFWTEFSEFGTSSVSLNDTSLEIEGSGLFDDVWGVSLGYGWSTSANRTWTVGAFHLTAPVSDGDRGLALALDRVWALGMGVSQPLAGGRSIDVNLNLIDYGEAPVDTGPAPWRGRVVGRTDDPYALLLDVAYHF